MKNRRLFSAIFALLFMQQFFNAHGQSLAISSNRTFSYASGAKIDIQLDATGGTKPYIWSNATNPGRRSPSLPVNLQISPAGRITGN